MKIIRVAYLLSAAVASFSQAVAGDVRHVAIPVSLQGTWALQTDDCSKADNSVIVLSAKSYAGAEGKCDVKWVVETASRHGSVYSAHLACLGTAEMRVTNVVLKPKDASQISVGTDLSSLKTYQRCPAGR